MGNSSFYLGSHSIPGVTKQSNVNGHSIPTHYVIPFLTQPNTTIQMTLPVPIHSNFISIPLKQFGVPDMLFKY